MRDKAIFKRTNPPVQVRKALNMKKARRSRSKNEYAGVGALFRDRKGQFKRRFPRRRCAKFEPKQSCTAFKRNGKCHKLAPKKSCTHWQ